MLDFGGSNSGLWPPELCVCFVGFVVLSRIEKLREVRNLYKLKQAETT